MGRDFAATIVTTLAKSVAATQTPIGTTMKQLLADIRECHWASATRLTQTDVGQTSHFRPREVYVLQDVGKPVENGHALKL